MLVYHFKGRIGVLEQKCDTMFEIMNNVVKEMRNIRTFVHNNGAATGFNPEMIVPNNETIMFCQRPNLGEFYQNYKNEDDGDEDEYEEEDEDEYEDNEEDESPKIIVSDTEVEDEQPVKVINIDFDNDDNYTTSVVNVEEIVTVQDESVNNDVDIEELESEDVDADAEVDADDDADAAEETKSNNEYLDKSVDYKKMDISYLRTMVITRGLATDTKKMKKNDLIRLLEQSQ